VYNQVQEAGGLMPYFECIEDVVEQYFQRYYAWLEAMDHAGIERQLFRQAGGELLTAGWNPVRLNKLGTLELRSMDSNYPVVILALVTLVVSAVDRVCREQMTVRPQPGLKTFEWSGDRLWIPEFQFLNGELLYAAVTEGIANPTIRTYLDSVLTFAATEGKNSQALMKLKTTLGEYHTTETQILEQYAPTTDHLSHEEGLHLVRDCCRQLETEVNLLIESIKRVR
jgi:hypothetical protein